jgi:plasmid stabilization system protein ParE
MTIRILESAREDLYQGYLFYEDQQPGVGVYFLDTLVAEIDSLMLYGGIHPIQSGYHRMLSAKFPFAIYYRVDGDEVAVRAVLDCRQDPSAIADRLK